MEETILLVNMTMLLLIGGACSILFKKLRMPAAIGYIMCGIILSNYWVGESDETVQIVELLSDLGLVLMMFGIGMELNLKKLRKMGTFAAMVVMVQVPLMLTGGYIGGTLIGLNPLQSIVFGAIISGSSTAVITIVLAEQERISHADVETLILVTVIEDVAQVLVMSAISPMMSGSEMDVAGIIWMLLTVVVFMASSMIVGMLTIPKMLDYVGKKFSDEILLVVSLGLCFGLAYVSVCVGMSMAIGAFLMGVIVSQSRSHVAIGHEVEPMKEVFMMMFFISIGLLIKPMDIVNNIGTILLIYAIYFVLKAGSVILAYFLGNKPLRLSFYCSISLVAMGEFAFIISKEAYSNGIITEDFYASVIGAALVSMIFLPLINNRAEKICDVIQVRTPQFLVNSFLRFESMRSGFYSRMALSTKETVSNFKSRLTYTYFTLLLVVIIQIIFVLVTPSVSNFIYDHTPESVSTLITLAVVMLVNFIVLIPFLKRFTLNYKYLLKVYVEAERKAVAAGNQKSHSSFMKILISLIKINNWVYVVVWDFIILLLTPNSIDFLWHIIVAVAGIAIIAAYQLVSVLRRS